MNKLRNLIQVLNELPGIGKKSATRLAIKLIEEKNISIKTLGETIDKLNGLDIDDKTGLIIEDGQTIYNIGKPLMIVQNNLDAEAYRELFINQFNFFNLEINTIADISRTLLKEDKIKTLIDFIKEKEIKEIIFGLSPKRESEIITTLISNEIHSNLLDVKISKIATGVPIGGSIEHIDSNTIRRAVEKREKI